MRKMKCSVISFFLALLATCVEGEFPPGEIYSTPGTVARTLDYGLRLPSTPLTKEFEGSFLQVW